ncbi:hypothetical protein QCN29_26940 [Streptomyces sp. HNM0663]|uniref:Uncharacterized protein n=1 Tax=Streptomyces chengmaiensis TaxID=3040919 RepID=A0ABT6HWC3_9ACTN|nr:hypothetical protein [Streptomyces chengmaiensis]MDH2392349.1 hypothetical protein [Streptomyces chengmaiensis]
MTTHRPGQWPVTNPVPVGPVPAPPASEQQPQVPSRAEVAAPKVRLVVTVDLTGPYTSSREVAADLHEQTRYSTDCHTAIVRIGEDALRCCGSLGHSIAARFFLSAQTVEIHVPAGPLGAHLASEVQQHLRNFAADHARMLADLRPTG